MWSAIKSLVLKVNRYEINEIHFIDSKESDKTIIANKFNSYFIESINNISNWILSLNMDYSALQETYPNFKFSQITTRDLYYICKKIKNKKDPTNLNIKIVLDCFSVIGTSIVKIINGSFSSGEFPGNFKETTVIPIPKENDIIN